MSRAFVKEDDSGEPPIIPPRAALPAGVPNYVTPRGLDLLHAELVELEEERANLGGEEDESNRRRELAILNGRINALQDRINTAKVVDHSHEDFDKVRFGATVTLVNKSGGKPKERTFTIVGVDEASLAEGGIGFVAPIAKNIQGLKVGESTTMRIGPKEEILEVTAITYQ